MHISLCYVPVDIAKPPQLEDVSVIWQPGDGEPPALGTAFLCRDGQWRWSPEATLVVNQQSITHWSHHPDEIEQLSRSAPHA